MYVILSLDKSQNPGYTVLMQVQSSSERLAARVVYEVVKRNGFDEIWNDLDQDIRDEIGLACVEIVENSVETYKD